jgi:hypothetical protein
MPLFCKSKDLRPSYCVDVFGSLQEFDVLELGSFEGGHSYQLEKFNVRSLTCIESNPQSFLKSLIIKDAMHMRASFLFGDFLQYLAQCKKTFDLIFASGVLYHMEDPLNLLHLIAQHTDRVFLWALYMSETAASLTPVFKNPVLEGYSCRYFRYDYNNENSGRIYSGNDSYCCRMTPRALHPRRLPLLSNPAIPCSRHDLGGPRHHSRRRSLP